MSDRGAVPDQGQDSRTSRTSRRTGHDDRRRPGRLDELLDEIDQVLEENAEEFVKNYIQKGGSESDPWPVAVGRPSPGSSFIGPSQISGYQADPERPRRRTAPAFVPRKAPPSSPSATRVAW